MINKEIARDWSRSFKIQRSQLGGERKLSQTRKMNLCSFVNQQDGSKLTKQLSKQPKDPKIIQETTESKYSNE